MISIYRLSWRVLLNLLFILCLFSIIPKMTYAVENGAQNAFHPTIVNEQTPLDSEYEGVYLEIIKKKNILNVYLNHHIIFRFPVATGRAATQTPSGLYQIVTKVKEPWYIPKNIPGGSPQNPLGTRWMGLNVGQTNGYRYGLHGTNDPSSIGQHVSAGCIRLRNEDIEYLFRHIPLKTYVLIKEDE